MSVGFKFSCRQISLSTKSRSLHQVCLWRINLISSWNLVTWLSFSKMEMIFQRPLCSSMVAKIVLVVNHLVVLIFPISPLQVKERTQSHLKLEFGKISSVLNWLLNLVQGPSSVEQLSTQAKFYKWAWNQQMNLCRKLPLSLLSLQHLTSWRRKLLY